MKIPRPPHNWSVTPKQAVTIQKKLARAVRQTRPAKPLRYLAGVDAAFSRDERFCLAGVVLWDLKSRSVLESHTATRPLTFPYIPGLLTFREAPTIIAALRHLKRAPDGLICDGQGLAHPRRCGIATHLGLLLNLPTIGCAKSRLIGTYLPPGPKRGSRSPLRVNDEIIGAVLRTRTRVKPVFVSVGHAIDLDSAVQLILACACQFRLPEPTRLADRLVAAAKKRLALPKTDGDTP